MGTVAFGDPFEVAPDEEELARRRALEGLTVPQPATPTPTQAAVVPGTPAPAVEQQNTEALDREQAALEQQMADMDAGEGGALRRSMAAPAAPQQRIEDTSLESLLGQPEPAAEPSAGQRLTAPSGPQRRIEEIDLESLLNGSQSAAPSDQTAPQDKPAGALPLPPGAPAGKSASPAHDFTGADIADAFRRPLHAIGAGLQGALGRQAPAFQSQHDREQAQVDRAHQEETHAAELGARASAEERRARATEAAMQIRQQGAGESAALRREGMDRADARSTADREQRQAALEARQTGATPRDQQVLERLRMDRALEDPESEETARARQLIEGHIAALPPQAQARARAGLAPLTTGTQMAEYARTMRLDVRDALSRRGGGAAPGAPLQGQRVTPTEDTPAQALARANGWSDGEIASFGRSPREQAQLRTAVLHRMEQNRSAPGRGSRVPDANQVLVPGWNQVVPVPMSAQTTHMAQEESGTLASMRSQVGRLMEINQRVTAAQRAGAAVGVLTPMLGEARAIHEQLQNTLRVLGHYGVPSENELARMERLAPSLESVQGFINAVPAYQGILATQTRNTHAHMLNSYGLEPAQGGIDAQRRRPAGAAPAPGAQAPAQGGRMRIRLADGRTGTLPAGTPLPPGAQVVNGP